MARSLYLYAFLVDLIPLYPLYALLFADSGLSAAQISTLLIIWSLTTFTVEVPSGVLADLVPRRRLLAAAPLLSAAGFALWTFLPAYPSFAAGFVLWGCGLAIASGTLQALVYDELDRAGAASSYARLIGRSRALGTTAMVAAGAAAAPVLAYGGYTAVGAASIAAALAAVPIGLSFPEGERSPEHRPARNGSAGHEPARNESVWDGSSRGECLREGAAEDGSAGGGGTGKGEREPLDLPTPPDPLNPLDAQAPPGVPHPPRPPHPPAPPDPPDAQVPPARAARGLGPHVAVMRTALNEVRHARGARTALVAVAVLMGVTALDEYLPFLARSLTGDTALVPVLLVPAFAAAAAGEWLAGRGTRHAAALTAAGAALLAVGALTGHPLGMLPVAAAFGVFEWASVAAETRLQDAVSGGARATVVSMSGFGAEAVAIVVFAAYGLGTEVAGPGALFAGASLLFLAVAPVLRRRALGGHPRSA